MRDRRRFGPGPYPLGLRRLEERDGFPFDLAAVEQVERLRLTERVTLPAGDNGTSPSPRTASPARASTSSTSRRPRCRSAARCA